MNIRRRLVAAAVVIGLAAMLGGVAVASAGSTIAVRAVAAPAAEVQPPLAADPQLPVDPAYFTAAPEVMLHVGAPPAEGTGLLRLSNDWTTFVEVPWTSAEIPWSLIDPTAGGTDADGTKYVVAWYGIDGTWQYQRIAEVVLDRTGGQSTAASVWIREQVWRGWLTPLAARSVVGGQARTSMDGATWSDWKPITEESGFGVDLWAAGAGGGAWFDGDHRVYYQMRDPGGILSPVGSAIADIRGHDMPAPANGQGPVSVGFTFPRPAITGRLYTIKPVYPAGYTVPDDAWCQWTLHWGDDASIMSNPNPTWGELLFERAKSSGACDEWTFTLPYRSARQFSWMFQMYAKGPNPKPDMEATKGYYTSSNNEDQVFRALQDSTSERMTASNVPIAYLLPETTVSQAGEPVTYRLYATGSTAVPQTGDFWTYPINCYLNPQWSQHSGSSYTYTPNCNGPWVTGWTGAMKGGYMRSQYDPLVDGRKPKVSSPKTGVRTGATGARIPVTVSWSGRDSGSGLARFDAQVSRNGGPWVSISLAGRLSTSLTRTLATDGTYRFRVRARDRVGNVAAWVTGPTLRARTIQEGATAIRWSGSWTTGAIAGALGGKDRVTSAAGATAKVVTAASSIGWVARKGPGLGQAAVLVDGVQVATVDLGATATTGPVVVWSRRWATTGTHTITIRNLGTAGRPNVVVDAFQVVR